MRDSWHCRRPLLTTSCRFFVTANSWELRDSLAQALETRRKQATQNRHSASRSSSGSFGRKVLMRVILIRQLCARRPSTSRLY